MVGDVGYLSNRTSAYTILPGDIFIPTAVQDNVSETKIDNLYKDVLISALEENNMSYRIINMVTEKEEIARERLFPNSNPPVNIVLGRLFTTDSLVGETKQAIQRMRERNLRAIDMEAALVIHQIQFLRPDMRLYLGFRISDIPGSLNLDAAMPFDQQEILKRKDVLVRRVFSLTAHEILQKDNRKPQSKDDVSSSSILAAAKTEGGQSQDSGSSHYVTDSFEGDKNSSSIGGVDFRALPIVNQSVNTPMLKLSAANLNRLSNLNLDSEWAQIQNMLNMDIILSKERIKEYVITCCLRQALDGQMDKVLGCVADIMRMEEDRVSDADAELKDMLVLIEAGKPESELQLDLSHITISPQEPKLAVP